LLEWLKWLEILNFSEIQIAKRHTFQSFCSGIITGMLTPNMQGNFIGRIYYFERKNRIELIVSTLISNYAQFLMSIIFGVFGLIFLNISPIPFNFSTLLFTLVLGGILFLYFYFNFEKISKKLAKKKHVLAFFVRLKQEPVFRWKLMFLSLIRYFIFVLQFGALLGAFGIPLSFELVFWIFQVYLWVTIAPSLFLGKLAIRESISLWVLGFAGFQQQPILLASLSIWVLNLFIPTMISLLIAKKK
jgi:hypothetical protein